MATHGTTVFLTRFQVWQRTVMHTRSVSSRTSTVATATVVLSAILARSAVIALSQRPSLSWRLTRTFGIHCLHPCGARTLSPFKFTQQSTSLLSSLVGKNIRKVILFEWVILFKNPTVIVLIGSYIYRVNVIKVWTCPVCTYTRPHTACLRKSNIQVKAADSCSSNTYPRQYFSWKHAHPRSLWCHRRFTVTKHMFSWASGWGSMYMVWIILFYTCLVASGWWQFYNFRTIFRPKSV